MGEPKSLESSVQQFYQSVEGGVEPVRSDLKKQQIRPQTAIIDDHLCVESAMKATKLTESIRNELDIHVSEDPIGSFFHDLSGWDLDKNKTESLDDNSCLSYLQDYEKRDEDSDLTIGKSRKKKTRTAMVIRALLASAKKPSTASSVGYRSKNEWGSEEDSNARPYALDIHVPGIPSHDEFEDEIENGSINVSNQEITEINHALPISYRSDTSGLDQAVVQLIQVAAAKAKQKLTDSRPVSTLQGNRAVSGGSRPVYNQHNCTLASAEKGRRGDKMAVMGQKYHNSDSYSQDKLLNRPLSGIRDQTSLPKITNTSKKFGLVPTQGSKKESIHNNIISEKKFSGVEIPKWYTDSGTKPTHDHNLIRYMEIMGSKSRLRTPRKLSSSGFQSLPMPNQPPETRGFVFEKKPRGLSAVIDEVISNDQSIKVDVLKVPIINPNQRSFVEEVELNRQGKNRK